MTPVLLYVFFFNDTATTEIYTLSLHDALPIYQVRTACLRPGDEFARMAGSEGLKSTRGINGTDSRTRSEGTRLNSSHANISYAVFCLKKKKQHTLMKHLTVRGNPRDTECT